MALMAKTAGASGYENHSASGRDFPLTIKTGLQCVFLIAAVILMAFFCHRSYNSHRLRNWEEFASFVNRTPHRPFVSSAARGLPTEGELFCWVEGNDAFMDDSYPELQAVQQTWLRQCINGQIFVSNLSHRLRKLPYRTVFHDFDGEQKDAVAFWKLFRGFLYAFHEISADFHWYLNAKLDTFVFVPSLLNRLRRLDHTKPYVVISSRENIDEKPDVLLLSNGALRAFRPVDDRRCPFDEDEAEGFKRCFLNFGADVFDESGLHLRVVRYADDGRWFDVPPEKELISANNLLALTQIQPREILLAKMLTSRTGAAVVDRQQKRVDAAGGRPQRFGRWLD